MKYFRKLFCKHNWQHEHNLFMVLNDDWPCKMQAIEKCDKCNKDRIVTKIMGEVR